MRAENIVLCAIVAGAAVLVSAGAEAQALAVKGARVVSTQAREARVEATVSNPSMYATYLVGAASDVAERAEFRDLKKKDARVAEVEVPAYGSVSFERAGLSVVLVNLKRALQVGERIEIVLVNEVQAKTRVSAVVAGR